MLYDEGIQTPLNFLTHQQYYFEKAILRHRCTFILLFSSHRRKSPLQFALFSFHYWQYKDSLKQGALLNVYKQE